MTRSLQWTPKRHCPKASHLSVAESKHQRTGVSAQQGPTSTDRGSRAARRTGLTEVLLRRSERSRVGQHAGKRIEDWQRCGVRGVSRALGRRRARSGIRIHPLPRYLVVMSPTMVNAQDYLAVAHGPKARRVAVAPLANRRAGSRNQSLRDGQYVSAGILLGVFPGGKLPAGLGQGSENASGAQILRRCRTDHRRGHRRSDSRGRPGT